MGRLSLPINQLVSPLPRKIVQQQQRCIATDILNFMRIRSLVVLVTLALVGTSCSSSSTSGGDPNAKTPAEAYITPGPYSVGITTLTLDRGPEVEVWYPAAEKSDATDTYDIRDFTPEAIRALLTGDAPATFTVDATRDAKGADKKFPVVLFSHGASGVRVQSSFLTAHLASWGIVVVAPDHWSRDLPRALVGQTVGTSADTPADLFDALDLVLATDSLKTMLDVDNIAIVGHSAGGGTALLASSDERVDGYVSMASGDLRSDAASEMPNKPSFFIAGALDQIVTVADRTRPAFEKAPSPSLLWVIDEVGHNGFDDFCTFGNGTGIIGVAEASGLGPLLAGNPSLRRLGEDGCVPPAADVTKAFPIIRHAVTAWLRNLFGIDEKPLGLLPDTEGLSDAYELKVSVIEAK
jgi:dienelactone hydrolase